MADEPLPGRDAPCPSAKLKVTRAGLDVNAFRATASHTAQRQVLPSNGPTSAKTPSAPGSVDTSGAGPDLESDLGRQRREEPVGAGDTDDDAEDAGW